MQLESLSWCLGQLEPGAAEPAGNSAVAHAAGGAAGWPPLGSDRPAGGPLLSRMAPAPRYSSLNA